MQREGKHVKTRRVKENTLKPWRPQASVESRVFYRSSLELLLNFLFLFFVRVSICDRPGTSVPRFVDTSVVPLL